MIALYSSEITRVLFTKLHSEITGTKWQNIKFCNWNMSITCIKYNKKLRIYNGLLQLSFKHLCLLMDVKINCNNIDSALVGTWG